MSYLDIPVQAVKILWKHKVFWIYAFTVFVVPILVILTGGNIFLHSIDLSHPEKVAWLWDPLASRLGMTAYFVMVLILSLCATLSSSGVLKGVSLLLDGEKVIHFSFIVSAGLRYFGRVGQVLFLFLGILGVITLVGIRFGFIYSAVFPVLFLLVWYLSRIIMGVMMPAMIQDSLGFFDAWRCAWEILYKKLSKLILITFLLVGLTQLDQVE